MITFPQSSIETELTDKDIEEAEWAGFYASHPYYKKPKKCTCGAHYDLLPTHSDWCDTPVSIFKKPESEENK